MQSPKSPTLRTVDSHPATLLAVSELRVALPTARGRAEALRGVSFSIGAGETVGLIGESGCGKSMTALAIAGLLPDGAHVSGRISFDGRELVGLDDGELCRLRGDRIGMVFQEPMTALNPLHTIGDQVAEPLRLHRGASRRVARAEALRLLERVRLPQARARLDAYPHQLSGGQRQRVMIAMALACGPKLLIADEPTTALDVTIQGEILDLVAELDTALILITHDLGVVAGMCERINVMYAGLFMESGSAEQVFDTPRHPYTLGLLQSVPRLDAPRGRKLRPIPGSPRDMLRAPQACPFAPRCSYEVPQSRQEVPPLVEVERGHYVACFNPVPADAWRSEREVA